MIDLKRIHEIGVRLATYGSGGPHMNTLVDRLSQANIHVAGVRLLARIGGGEFHLGVGG